MKDEPEGVGRRPAAVGDAHRGDESRALAVGDHIRVALDHFGGWRVLADCWCGSSQGETTGQRGAAFQEFPSSRFFRAHGPPSQMSLAGNRLPAGGSIRRLLASDRSTDGATCQPATRSKNFVSSSRSLSVSPCFASRKACQNRYRSTNRWREL